MPTVEELGQRVKSKYSGAYDSLSDAEVGRRVKLKYPGAYDDFVDAPVDAPAATNDEPGPIKKFLSATAGSFAAGIGGVIEGLGGALTAGDQMAGAQTGGGVMQLLSSVATGGASAPSGIGPKVSAVGAYLSKQPKWLEDAAQKPDRWTDPAFLSSLAFSGVGSTAASFLPGGIAANATGKAAVVARLIPVGKLRAAAQVAAGTGVGAFFESLTDAGSAYNEAIEKHGASPETAAEVFNATLKTETPVTALLSAPEHMLPGGKGKLAKALWGVYNAASEGVEEVAQGAAQRHAMNQVLGTSTPLLQGAPEEFVGGILGGAGVSGARLLANRAGTGSVTQQPMAPAEDAPGPVPPAAPVESPAQQKLASINELKAKARQTLQDRVEQFAATAEGPVRVSDVTQALEIGNRDAVRALTALTKEGKLRTDTGGGWVSMAPTLPAAPAAPAAVEQPAPQLPAMEAQVPATEPQPLAAEPQPAAEPTAPAGLPLSGKVRPQSAPSLDRQTKQNQRRIPKPEPQPQPAPQEQPQQEQPPTTEDFASLPVEEQKRRLAEAGFATESPAPKEAPPKEKFEAPARAKKVGAYVDFLKKNEFTPDMVDQISDRQWQAVAQAAGQQPPSANTIAAIKAKMREQPATEPAPAPKPTPETVAATPEVEKPKVVSIRTKVRPASASPKTSANQNQSVARKEQEPPAPEPAPQAAAKAGAKPDLRELSVDELKARVAELERRKAAEKEPAQSKSMASSLRKIADAMEPTIQQKLNPAIANQNVTARRSRIAGGMAAEGARMQRVQQQLRTLADMHESGNVPESLRGVRTKSALEDLQPRYDERGQRIANRFPKPSLTQHDVRSLLEKGTGPGTAEGRRILERKAGAEWAYFSIEDVSKIEAVIDRAEAKGVRTKYMRERFAAAKRLNQAGITEQNYEAAIAAVEGLGAKPKEKTPEQKIRDAERELIGLKIEGFFPTPKPLAEQMAARADIQPGMAVLEPSAGNGAIADALAAAGAKPVTIEPVERLREILAMKGHNVSEKRNFLEHYGEYDRIVMNPPFEQGQDIDHVRHAFAQLKPGGRVVAIMSEGSFGRGDKKAREFREWLEREGGTSEKLPEGSFTGKDALRQTGVATRLVVIDRPKAASTSREWLGKGPIIQEDKDKTRVAREAGAEAATMAHTGQWTERFKVPQAGKLFREKTLENDADVDQEILAHPSYSRTNRAQWTDEQWEAQRAAFREAFRKTQKEFADGVYDDERPDSSVYLGSGLGALQAWFDKRPNWTLQVNPRAWLKGALKDGVVRDVIDSFRPMGSVLSEAGGGAGGDIMIRIRRANDNGEVLAGSRLVKLVDARLDKLTDQEAQNLMDALEGREEPMNDRVRNAYRVAQNLHVEIGGEAMDLGMEMRDEDGSKKPVEIGASAFPHIVRPVDALKSGPVRRDVLRNLVHIGAAENAEQATAMLDGYIATMQSGKREKAKVDAILKHFVNEGIAANEDQAWHILQKHRRDSMNPKRYAPLEYAQPVVPFWDPDPRRVLPQHVVGASMRTAHVAELGQENEVITKGLRRIEDAGGNAAEAKKQVDRILNHVDQAETKEMRISRLLRAVQGFKLGLAAVNNATQGTLNTMLEADLGAVAVGFKSMFTTAGRRFAIESGATIDPILHESVKELADSSRVLDRYLRATGFNATERANRVFAANAGAAYAQKLAKRGDKRSREVLTELGLDAEEVIARGRLTPEEVLLAAKKFSDITQFRARPEDLPAFAAHPMGRVFFQFKSFAYAQTRFVARNTIGEIQRGNYGRAMRNLLVLGVAFPLAGELVREIRALLSGRERKDLEGIPRLLDSMAAVGTLGMFYDMVEAGDQGRFLEFLTGPTFSEVAKLGKNLLDGDKDADEKLVRMWKDHVAPRLGPLRRIGQAIEE